MSKTKSPPPVLANSLAMMVSTTDTEPDELQTRADQAQAAWKRFGLRLRSITPKAILRFILVIGLLIGLGWLIIQTWVSLTPFVFGAIIAYIMLPLVDWLDRFMPRPIAVLLAITLVVGLIGWFFALLVPILTRQGYAIYLLLPDAEDLRRYQTQLQTYIATLPEPIRISAANIFSQTTNTVRANLDTVLDGVLHTAVAAVLGLTNTLSFILGFLVVPAWLLTILNEQQQAKQAVNRLLPDWLYADFWAVARIIDRVLGTFVRGQMVTAVITGGLTYLGLEFVVRLFGLTDAVRYQVVLAMIAGITQLIPSIGPFLGFIPALLISLSISRELALFVVGVYIVVQQIIANIVVPNVERRVVSVHPAILILIIVSLSQFGLLWVLLAAPITAILHDLFHYFYSRLSDASQPVRKYDGEISQPKVQGAGRPLPLIYRRQQALRQTRPSPVADTTSRPGSDAP